MLVNQHFLLFPQCCISFQDHFNVWGGISFVLCKQFRCGYQHFPYFPQFFYPTKDKSHSLSKTYVCYANPKWIWSVLIFYFCKLFNNFLLPMLVVIQPYTFCQKLQILFICSITWFVVLLTHLLTGLWLFESQLELNHKSRDEFILIFKALSQDPYWKVFEEEKFKLTLY